MEIRVLLIIKNAKLSRVENSDGSILETKSALQSYRIPGTVDFDTKDLASWIANHIHVTLDGTLTSPELFKTVRFAGSSGPTKLQTAEQLTIAETWVYLDITSETENLTIENLVDLNNLIYISANFEDSIAEFCGYECHGVEICDEEPDNLSTEAIVWYREEYLG